MSDGFPFICPCGCGRRTRTQVAVPPPDLSARSMRSWHWTISTRKLDEVLQSRVIASLIASDLADRKIDDYLRTSPALTEAARRDAESAWRASAVASLKAWSALGLARVPAELAK